MVSDDGDGGEFFRESLGEGYYQMGKKIKIRRICQFSLFIFFGETCL